MGLPQPSHQDHKSVVRQIAEHRAKQQLFKKGRKFAKKALKKGSKLAAQAAVRAGVTLGKLLLTLLGAIGLPTILVLASILGLVILVSLVSSFMFGSGEGLTDSQKEIYDYIVEQADKTVDLSKPEQAPYRVPESLISSVIQLDAMMKEDEKEVIREMTESLAPEFTYDQFNEWTETQTQVCRDGSCGSWSEITRTDNWVTKLTNVDYWKGFKTITYTPYTTDWVITESVSYETETYTVTIDGEEVERTRTITVVTKTKTRHQRFTSEVHEVEDYTRFDNALNEYNLGLQDKKLVEVNYLFQDGEINYIEWLQSRFGSGFWSGGFNGTIIPGSSVPAQFMEYYLGAEARYGVDWYVLAALHYVETGFSTHPTMISSAGAIGHLQFLPASWVGWVYNIGGGRVSPSLDITDLNVIARGGGYGVDADGDGKADPWNVADAIYSAAHYLSKSGYAEDPRKAIFNYNRADWYVNKVMSNAQKFRAEAVYQPHEGDIPPITADAFMRPATGDITSGYGPRWGSFHHGVDIGLGGRSNVPIVAAADGIVVRSYLSGSYGHCVIIEHNIKGVQYQTLYAHMTHRAVSAGQNVKKGQFLGYMGNTGRSKGAHLHFEIHSPAWTANKAHSLNPVLYVPF